MELVLILVAPIVGFSLWAVVHDLRRRRRYITATFGEGSHPSRRERREAIRQWEAAWRAQYGARNNPAAHAWGADGGGLGGGGGGGFGGFGDGGGGGDGGGP
jgi:hypothetical protein